MLAALLREISLQAAAATASPRIETIGVAMTDSAHGADRGCEWCRTRLRFVGPPSLRRTLSAISVIVMAIELAGCARDPSRREVNLGRQEVRAKAVHLASRARPHSEGRPHAEAQQHVDLRVRRP